MSTAPKIGILGHFADANVGDDACPTALLYHLRRIVPDAEFVLFCRFPEVAKERFALPTYPVKRLPPGQTRSWQPPEGMVEAFGEEPESETNSGWRSWAKSIPPIRLTVRAMRAIREILPQIPAELRFLWGSYRHIRGIDLLLVAGSNPIFDYFGGYWGYPFTMWKWTTLARLAGVKLAFVCVGAGPIVSRRSGRLLASVLRRAAYVSFRDEGSRQLMREHGYEGPDFVCPDLAHGLPFTPVDRPASEKLRVGINPMIVYHGLFWPVSDRKLYDHYVKTLAALAAELYRGGHEVFLYGTQKDDAVPAEEIQNTLRNDFPGVAVPRYEGPETVPELLALCSSADLLVSTRFHGAIFGVVTRRPTLAICYQGKTREVLEAAELGEFAFDFEDVDFPLLWPALEQLRDRRSAIGAALDRHAERMRARLSEQDAQLVELLPPCKDKLGSRTPAPPR
jgi:polysaccharide pyruvyl transferase WcaK-like protein